MDDRRSRGRPAGTAIVVPASDYNQRMEFIGLLVHNSSARYAGVFLHESFLMNRPDFEFSRSAKEMRKVQQGGHVKPEMDRSLRVGM